MKLSSYCNYTIQLSDLITVAQGLDAAILKTAPKYMTASWEVEKKGYDL